MNRENVKDWQFVDTHWSLVFDAARSRGPDQLKARAAFYQNYRKPLLTRLHRAGYSPSDSEDICQDFFFHLLSPAHKFFSEVREEKGKLRTFLLKTLELFLCNEWRKSKAKKRNPDCAIESIDATECQVQIPDANPTPDVAYDRAWALQLIDIALDEVRQEYCHRNDSVTFDLLYPHITGHSKKPIYAEIAVMLRLTEDNVKQKASRLRKRFAKSFRQVVQQTVPSGQIDDELRYLQTVLRT